MNDGDIALLMRDGMVVMLKLGAGDALRRPAGRVPAGDHPIYEATLAFVPKVLALCAALVLLGPFMLATLSGYARLLLDRLVAAGAS